MHDRLDAVERVGTQTARQVADDVLDARNARRRRRHAARHRPHSIAGVAQFLDSPAAEQSRTAGDKNDPVPCGWRHSRAEGLESCKCSGLRLLLHAIEGGANLLADVYRVDDRLRRHRSSRARGDALVKTFHQHGQTWVRPVMPEDDAGHILRGALERLPRPAIGREQDPWTSAWPEQARHRSGDIVGAHHAVGADNRLVLLDGPPAQRDQQHASAVPEPQQRVHIATGSYIHADDGNGGVVEPGTGTDLIDERVHGMREDVFRLIDGRNRPPHLSKREEALDVHDTADGADLLAREDRRAFEEVLVTGTDVNPVLGGERQNLFRLGLRHRKWLLDVGVHAGLDECPRDRRMGVRGRHDVNDVWPCLCQKRVDVSDDSRVGGNESLQLLGVGKRVGDADYFGARRLGNGSEVV